MTQKQTARDWRTKQGYRKARSCSNCKDCAVNYLFYDLTKYYCTREYKGNPPRELHKCTTEERDKFITSYGSTHEVRDDTICNYWKEDMRDETNIT